MRSLRDGDFYIVGNSDMLTHCRKLIDEHNLADINVRTISRDGDSLRGLSYSIWIEVDHDVRLTPRAREIIILHNVRVE